MHEVRNTFGDKHTYVVPVDSAGLHHEFAKEMHVSPFMNMDFTYRFAVTLPRNHISVGITQQDTDGPLLRVSLRATRLEFTDRNLITLFVTDPLVTLKAIVVIHWGGAAAVVQGPSLRPAPGSEPSQCQCGGLGADGGAVVTGTERIASWLFGRMETGVRSR